MAKIATKVKKKKINNILKNQLKVEKMKRERRKKKY